MLFLSSICHVVGKGDIREEGCEKNLPHAPKLPLMSYLSNFTKIVHLHENLTERDV